MPDSYSYWMPHEIDKLYKLAQTDKSVEQIALELGRSVSAVRAKARSLHVIILGNTKRNWTIEEVVYLRENWGQVSMAVLAKTLHRTDAAIKQQAVKMNLGRADELTDNVKLSLFVELSGISRDRLVGSLSSTHGFPLIRKPVLRRRQYFINLDKALKWMYEHQELYDASKVSEDLFIPEPKWLTEKRRRDREDKSHIRASAFVKRIWTKDELARLRDMVRIGYDYSEIAKEFGVHRRAIEDQVIKENFSWSSPDFWKGSDFKFIREHWETMSDEEMAKHLHKTTISVTKHRNQMGLLRTSQKKRYSEEDDQFIRDHYIEMSDKEMAEKLGKSVNSLKAHRLTMGLIRQEKNEAYSPEEEQYIRDHWQNTSDTKMAQYLGRTVESVKQFRWKHRFLLERWPETKEEQP